MKTGMPMKSSSVPGLHGESEGVKMYTGVSRCIHIMGPVQMAIHIYKIYSDL